MSINLKICGMREPDNILAVGELQPEFMGFIFYPQSPRFVTDNFSLPIGLPSSVKKVGVFVNEEYEKILNMVTKYALDFVQLHGNEPEAFCSRLKEGGVSVIKAFSIDQHFTFKAMDSYKKVVDYFLFDAKGKFYGGNASTFDWNLLKQYDQEVPFFLSGGISPENIQEIAMLSGMNLYAVDINSGVEESPGVKDVKKIKEFLINLKPSYRQAGLNLI